MHVVLQSFHIGTISSDSNLKLFAEQLYLRIWHRFLDILINSYYSYTSECSDLFLTFDTRSSSITLCKKHRIEQMDFILAKKFIFILALDGSL